MMVVWMVVWMVVEMAVWKAERRGQMGDLLAD